MENAIARVVKILGSQRALARVCDLPPQAVTRWLREGKLPARHAVKVEHAVEGKVTRRELAPDFDWDEAARPAFHSAATVT